MDGLRLRMDYASEWITHRDAKRTIGFRGHKVIKDM